MFVLFFYMIVNGVSIPLSKGEVDHFDTKQECVDKGNRMYREMNNTKIGFKCIEIMFIKQD